MSIEITSLNYHNTASSWTSPLVSTVGFSYLKFALYCKNNATLTIGWSMDGIVLDTQTVSMSVVSGQTNYSTEQIKSKYVQVSVSTSPASEIKLQTFFFRNVGKTIQNATSQGIQILNQNLDVRSLTCTDNSITIAVA